MMSAELKTLLTHRSSLITHHCNHGNDDENQKIPTQVSGEIKN